MTLGSRDNHTARQTDAGWHSSQHPAASRSRPDSAHHTVLVGSGTRGSGQAEAEVAHPVIYQVVEELSGKASPWLMRNVWMVSGYVSFFFPDWDGTSPLPLLVHVEVDGCMRDQGELLQGSLKQQVHEGKKDMMYRLDGLPLGLTAPRTLHGLYHRGWRLQQQAQGSSSSSSSTPCVVLLASSMPQPQLAAPVGCSRARPVGSHYRFSRAHIASLFALTQVPLTAPVGPLTVHVQVDGQMQHSLTRTDCWIKACYQASARSTIHRLMGAALPVTLRSHYLRGYGRLPDDASGQAVMVAVLSAHDFSRLPITGPTTVALNNMPPAAAGTSTASRPAATAPRHKRSHMQAGSGDEAHDGDDADGAAHAPEPINYLHGPWHGQDQRALRQQRYQRRQAEGQAWEHLGAAGAEDEQALLSEDEEAGLRHVEGERSAQADADNKQTGQQQAGALQVGPGAGIAPAAAGVINYGMRSHGNDTGAGALNPGVGSPGSDRAPGAVSKQPAACEGTHHPGRRGRVHLPACMGHDSLQGYDADMQAEVHAPVAVGADIPGECMQQLGNALTDDDGEQVMHTPGAVKMHGQAEAGSSAQYAQGTAPGGISRAAPVLPAQALGMEHDEAINTSGAGLANAGGSTAHQHTNTAPEQQKQQQQQHAATVQPSAHAGAVAMVPANLQQAVKQELQQTQQRSALCRTHQPVHAGPGQLQHRLHGVVNMAAGTDTAMAAADGGADTVGGGGGAAAAAIKGGGQIQNPSDLNSSPHIIDFMDLLSDCEDEKDANMDQAHAAAGSTGPAAAAAAEERVGYSRMMPVATAAGACAGACAVTGQLACAPPNLQHAPGMNVQGIVSASGSGAVGSGADVPDLKQAIDQCQEAYDALVSVLLDAKTAACPAIRTYANTYADVFGRLTTAMDVLQEHADAVQRMAACSLAQAPGTSCGMQVTHGSGSAPAVVVGQLVSTAGSLRMLCGDVHALLGVQLGQDAAPMSDRERTSLSNRRAACDGMLRGVEKKLLQIKQGLVN